MTRRCPGDRDRRIHRKRRRLRLEALECRRVLATFIVTTDADVIDPNDSVISLREAIASANSSVGLDTITFDADVFASPTKIDLLLGRFDVTEGLTIAGPGQHLVKIDAQGDSRLINFVSGSDDLTIQGVTLAGGRTVSDDLNSDVSGGAIRFASSGTLALNDATLDGNRTMGAGARGGALFTDSGNIVLTRSTVSGNSTAGINAKGGGIYSGSGLVLLTESVVTGNSTTGRGASGGGIYSSGNQLSFVRSSLVNNRTIGDAADGGGVFSNNSVTVESSVVSGNTTSGNDADGGAIFVGGLLAVLRSDVSGNSTLGTYSGGGALTADSATVVINQSSITNNQTSGRLGYGGGLFAVRSDVTITGSTISSNMATGNNADGGGVSLFLSSVSVSSSTITLNTTTGDGGGIAFSDSQDKTFEIQNTIVAGNLDSGTAPDFRAPSDPQNLTVTASVIGDNTGTTLSEAQAPDSEGNYIGDPAGDGIIDPQLGPLVLVGRSRLHPLVSSSVAIDAGNNALVIAISNDQRGEPFDRVDGVAVDIGSFERQTLDPASLVVTTASDELDFSNSNISLREAITAANGLPGPDVISFDSTIFAGENVIALSQGELTITESVSIQGTGRRLLSIDAEGTSRVIAVAEGSGDVTLADLTITGGFTTADNSSGGGIRFLSSGTLTLRDSVLTDNHTGGTMSFGGGVYSRDGEVTLQRVSVVGNSTVGARASGGGVFSGGGITVSDSTIAENSTRGAGSDGGGIFSNRLVGDAIQVIRSTVSGNSAGARGGGIATGDGALNLLNSTLSQNAAAGNGGGIFAADVSAVDHRIVASTIAENSSGGVGGGIHVGADNSSTVTIANSIVATNNDSGSAPDLGVSRVAGQLSIASTLIGDNTGTDLSGSPTADSFGNLIGAPDPGAGLIDPLLGTLALRGGVTSTHSLRVGSPAIDAGSQLLVDNLVTDQRGEPFVRNSGAAPDMGAFETQTLSASALTVNTSVDEFDFSNSEFSLREALAVSTGSAGVDTIRFDAAVFALPTSIDLVLSELQIDESVIIAGPGQDMLRINAQGNSRVVNVMTDGVDLTLSGVTITGGVTTGENQILETTHSGGGIRFDATGSLTLQGVTVDGNRTSGFAAGGGGIFVNGASLTLIASRVSNNSTEGDLADGGGVFVADNAVSIIDSTLRDNSTAGDVSRGGGLSAADATVSVLRSSFIDNRTTGSSSDGGGIESRGGDVMIDTSVLGGNSTESADSDGGGLFYRDGRLVIIATSVQSNSTAGDASSGGGIAASFGDVTIASSAIISNRTSGDGSDGAGISVDRTALTIINTTFSANSASGSGSAGGAIDVGQNGDVSIVNATIAGNSAAGDGGGINATLGVSDLLEIANSIIAGNSDSGTAPDLKGPLNPSNATIMSSLIGDNTGTGLAEAQTPDASGNLIGSSSGGGIIDPMLAPLANNGGATRTHALLTGSVAINSGDNALALDADSNPLTSDQRREPFLRFFGSVDMGAFELQPPREPIIIWANPANIFEGTPLSSVQLNASSDVAGTFDYTPGLGTILDLGDAQTLMLEFTPDDTVNYVSTTVAVQINVVDQSDLGDAPDSYATLRLSDGPRHLVGSLTLGATVDADVDGQPTADASGDGDDDDGVRFITSLVASEFAATTATVTVNASARGLLDAWIDFDGDGVFDHTAEHIADGISVDLFSGDNRIPITIPAGANSGTTYARFRISSAGGLNPIGQADDGEVEDYVVTILDGATTPTIHLELPRGAVTLLADFGDLVVQRRGDDLFRAPSSDVGRYEIKGDEFSNVLTIDNSRGAAIPSGGFSFDGVDRVNTVRLVGPGSSLDLSQDSNVSLRNVDVIDMSDPAESTLSIDGPAARAMDPNNSGIIVTGSEEDRIVFVDGPQWRMAEPIAVAGFSFSVVELSNTFVQVDFVSAWQNLAQPSDVNNDGDVTAGDALRIINELGRRTFSDPDDSKLVDPATVSPWPNTYFDQNGDRFATALDALRVINQIARESNDGGSGEGEAIAVSWPRSLNSTPLSVRDSDRSGDLSRDDTPSRKILQVATIDMDAEVLLSTAELNSVARQSSSDASEVDQLLADFAFVEGLTGGPDDLPS